MESESSPSDAAQHIARALAARQHGRELTENLHRDWTRLLDAVDSMRGMAVTACRALTAVPALSSEQVAALRVVERLAGTELTALMDELSPTTARLSSVLGRIHRPTVNIGVIGLTKQGKSALLRAISGLPPSVIPSNEKDPTTAARSRIHHSPGEQRAVVKLHTWESFRDGYLTGLHKSAGVLDLLPSTPARRSPRPPHRCP